MVRLRTYNGLKKALVAGATTIFNQGEIFGPGVVMNHFATDGASPGTGTNGNWVGKGGVEKFRIKYNGGAMWDISYRQLAAYIARMAVANYRPQLETLLSGNALNNTPDQSIDIPLNFYDNVDHDLADDCGFPMDGQIAVELDTAAAAAAPGNLTIMQTLSDKPPSWYALYLSQFLNFSASQANQRFPLTQPGIFRGLCIPTRGVARLKIVIAGREIFNATGAPAGNNPGLQDLLWQCERSEQASGLVAPVNFNNGTGATPNIAASFNAVAQQGLQTGEHTFLKLEALSEMAVGASYIEMDTNASWQTAFPDNAVAIYSVVPQGA